RERQLQVLEGAESEELVIDRAVAAEDRLGGPPGRPQEAGGPLLADRSPAAREGGEVDEVEPAAGAEGLEPGPDPVDRQLLPERDQSLEGEDGVVEVAGAGAVARAAVRVELLVEKPRDGLSGLLQEAGRQPRDLQHFEPQTHCSILR